MSRTLTKTCDHRLAIRIPPTAETRRWIIDLAQFPESHALAFSWANLIRANDHNHLAMNRAVREVADAEVDGNRLHLGMLNRVEAAVPCYA
jgi:coenzyme F420-reducing hydrogenase alpha subunit